MKYHLPNRNFLLLAGGSLLLLAFIFGAILPLHDHNESLRNRMERTREDLENLLVLEKEYQRALALAADSRQQAVRNDDFTLFSFLEETASGQGIKDKIEFMRPSEKFPEEGLKLEMVEMRLGEIPLDKLVPFLHTIESSNELVRVRRMTIRSQKNASGLLNVDMTVVTYSST